VGRAEGRSGSVGSARAMGVHTDGLRVAGVNEGEPPLPLGIGHSRPVSELAAS
jgi:hypothetical protein